MARMSPDTIRFGRSPTEASAFSTLNRPRPDDYTVPCRVRWMHPRRCARMLNQGCCSILP